MNVTREHAAKVAEVVSHGLVKGQGIPVPGKMCVEAAVCFALGLPHGDDPQCVGRAVRRAKIALNDMPWSSDEARANGMKYIAVAQLGSDKCDQVAFSRYLAEQVIRRIVPLALRAAIKKHMQQKHKDALEAAAVQCENDGNRAAALNAKSAAYAADADAAYVAAADAAYAADAAAAAYAADAAAAAYAAKRAVARDVVYRLFAEIILEGLKKVGSQGCQWLDLVK